MCPVGASRNVLEYGNGLVECVEMSGELRWSGSVKSSLSRIGGVDIESLWIRVLLWCAKGKTYS